MNDGKGEDFVRLEGKTHFSRFWYYRVIDVTRIGKLFYDLRYEGMKHIPSQGPAIILAKHQQYMDSLIIAMALKDEVQRVAHYFIKYSLPDFMEQKLGGIKFLTSENYKDLVHRHGREKAKALARDFNVKSYTRIQETLRRGEIILMYPEGGIRRRKMGEIRRAPLKMFREMEAALRQKIPVIPLGIEYARWYKDLFCCPPSRITLRVGKPRYFGGESMEEFCGVLYEDLKNLSGL